MQLIRFELAAPIKLQPGNPVIRSVCRKRQRFIPDDQRLGTPTAPDNGHDEHWNAQTACEDEIAACAQVHKLKQRCFSARLYSSESPVTSINFGHISRSAQRGVSICVHPGAGASCELTTCPAPFSQ